MSKKDPTDRYFSRHHRQPVSKKGGSVTEGGRPNISVVPDYKHVAFHRLFGNMEPSEIARELSNILATLNATWINPDWQIVARQRPKKP